MISVPDTHPAELRTMSGLFFGIALPRWTDYRHVGTQSMPDIRGADNNEKKGTRYGDKRTFDCDGHSCSD